MLELNNVSFAWPGRNILNDVSLVLNGGEILALLGPNGAGKSTLVRNILGQLTPSHADILLDGKLINGGSAAASGIAWVPQAITLYPKLSVNENLRCFAGIMGVAADEMGGQVAQALVLTGLALRKNDLAGDLSGGMQRMLNVGIALIAKPQLLILDEPTAGIDQRARQQLHQTLLALKARGLAILLTTHDLDDAKRLADKVAILAEGKLCAEGKVADLIQARFADQREVRVRWPEAQPRPELEKLLLQARLHEEQPGNWSGLLDNSDGKLDALVKQLLKVDAPPPDLVVREPGLDILIQGFLKGRRQTDA